MVGAAGRGLVGAGGELGLRPRGSRCALAVYKKKATDGGGGRAGGLTATIASTKIGPGFEFLQKLVPGSNPQKVDIFFLANLA